MRPKTSHCLLSLAALLPLAARADIYLCRGADGSLLTTDHLSADCLSNGGRQLNADGSVRRLIAPARSGAAGNAEHAAAEQSLQQQREDHALLVRYPDQAAFDAAERADILGPQSLIDSARKQIAALAVQKVQLDQESQFYVHHDMPVDLRGRIETNRVLMRQQQLLIAQQQAEQARIRAQYAALHTRLAVLWSGGLPP